MSFPEPSATQAAVTIERCSTHEDYRACMALERAIWNDPDEDLIPATVLMVTNKIGGHALLARDGERPVGFAVAFPAFHGEQRYLHSHIVGVVQEYRSRGLGRLIKMRQRETMRREGIALMEWTFDPLAIGNAYFNVARLGATMRRYYPNLYGVTASPLPHGLPTDRLVAEWRVETPRVERALAGSAPTAAEDAVRIVVPRAMEAWRKSGSSEALAAQARLRAEFEERFAGGYAVTAFRLEDGDGVYLLERQEDEAPSRS